MLSIIMWAVFAYLFMGWLTVGFARYVTGEACISDDDAGFVFIFWWFYWIVVFFSCIPLIGRLVFRSWGRK